MAKRTAPVAFRHYRLERKKQNRPLAKRKFKQDLERISQYVQRHKKIFIEE